MSSPHLVAPRAGAVRHLTQLTFPNPTCPVGCAEGKCSLDSTLGYVCSECVSPLIPNPTQQDGRCGCMPGSYYVEGGALECTQCDKGFYCLGGTFWADVETGVVTGPQRVECGPGLTTAGRRSVSATACGELSTLLDGVLALETAATLNRLLAWVAGC